MYWEYAVVHGLGAMILEVLMPLNFILVLKNLLSL